MLRNYIKITLRSLWKNKFYSLINISGLAVGITTSILILLFVSHEYSYDKFHKNGDRIYRAVRKLNWDGNIIQMFSTPEFGPSVTENNPDVLNYVRMLAINRAVVKSDERHRFFEDHFVFADTSFFSLFSFELLRGNRNSLSRPNTVVLTEETAKKYFGSVDAIGKTIYFDKDNLFEVVGIARKAPSNSTIQFDFVASLISLESMPAYKDGYVGNPAYPTYFLLRNKNDATKIENSLRKSAGTPTNESFMLEPFLGTHFGNNFGDFSNTQYVSTFLFIAILILALALINYMNLTTARASVRAKEVGIRKVVGARHGTLSLQFYVDSVITTIIAFALGLVLTEMTKPMFLSVLQEDIDSSFLSSPVFTGLIAALFIICAVFSGSYPAVVLPRFKPTEVLKGKLSGNGQGAWIRKGLTIFQFSVSVALIICSLVVQRQLDYLQLKKIGLHKEQVMVISLDPVMANDFNSLKNDLRQLPGVHGVAAASTSLFKEGYNIAFLQTPTTHEKVGLTVMSVDENFLETLDIQWDTKPEKNLGVGNYLINETAIEKLKIADSPIGHSLNLGDDHTGILKAEIAGVVKDFNYTSLRTEIQGLVMTLAADTTRVAGGSLLNIFYIRLEPSLQLNEQIASIKRIYEKYQHESPFEYYFLDDAFNRLYKGEERLSKIFNVFTVVGICIACMGLFGLVTFTTQRRTKEIGIRKVLGASVNNILSLLSWEFIVLMLISVTLATPLAWWAMQDWLSHFSYRIDIPLWIIIVSGTSTLVISLLTISIQAIRVALANPVNSLKNE